MINCAAHNRPKSHKIWLPVLFCLLLVLYFPWFTCFSYVKFHFILDYIQHSPGLPHLLRTAGSRSCGKKLRLGLLLQGAATLSDDPDSAQQLWSVVRNSRIYE